jgi:hypothetical protein
MFFAVFKKAAAFYLKGRLQFLKGGGLFVSRSFLVETVQSRS